jgi:hypothetical protein
VFPPPSPPGRLIVQSLYQTCGSALGDTVEVAIRLEDTQQEVDAAGLDFPYDPAVLEYVGYRRGDLTQSWAFFDAAQLQNKVRVGGFSSTSIPIGSSGAFVILRFVVSRCGSSAQTGCVPKRWWTTLPRSAPCAVSCAASRWRHERPRGAT